MELYQLRSFVAVAELGHLTRAAERLHVSQPAVSAQIKALEDMLGVTLFDRGPTGMALTGAGARILPLASRAIEAAAEVRRQASALQGEVNGHLRVGTLADPEVLRLGEVLAHAVERHPLLQLELKHEISGAAFAKVRDGELDASFYYGPLEHPSVAAISLRPLDFRIAVPAAWNVPVRDADWPAIAALPWVMTPPISSHHALASRFFDASGQAPATTIEADNELVVRSLVTAGVGVGLMREDLAQQAERAGEVAIWPGVRLTTALEFITPRDRAAEPAIAALLGLVADAWPEARARALVTVA